jgi:cell fate regulator YaaT (PSP1 superfamily)
MPDATDSPRAISQQAISQLAVVRFKGSRKSYYHNRAGVQLALGVYCFVEADRGCDLGQVVHLGPGHERWWRVADQQGVLGLASPEDILRLEAIRAEEREYLTACEQRVRARGLEMDLVGAERQFDGRKITFYFIAEGRVDFRELVRDLASVLRTRIELRQIGVRDEAKLVGGVGVCGRELCCATFMHDFVPVSLRMAKDQQLPLNPVKLSGLCGRLRCCLTYEHEDYRAILGRLPRLGSPVTWENRLAKVRKLDLVREEVTISFQEGEPEQMTVPVTALQWSREEPPRGPNDDAVVIASSGRRRGSRRRGSRGGEE